MVSDEAPWAYVCPPLDANISLIINEIRFRRKFMLKDCWQTQELLFLAWSSSSKGRSKRNNFYNHFPRTIKDWSVLKLFYTRRLILWNHCFVIYCIMIFICLDSLSIRIIAGAHLSLDIWPKNVIFNSCQASGFPTSRILRSSVLLGCVWRNSLNGIMSGIMMTLSNFQNIY